MKRIFVKICVWIPVIILLMFIFRFSNQSGEVSSGMSINVAQIIVNIADYLGLVDAHEASVNEAYVQNIHFYIRKAAHMSEYALLAVLVYIALFVDGIRFKLNGVLAGVFVLLFAIGDEIHQLFVPGRCGTYKDVIIDMSGCIIALIICFFVDRRRRNVIS